MGLGYQNMYAISDDREKEKLLNLYCTAYMTFNDSNDSHVYNHVEGNGIDKLSKEEIKQKTIDFLKGATGYYDTSKEFYQDVADSCEELLPFAKEAVHQQLKNGELTKDFIIKPSSDTKYGTLKAQDALVDSTDPNDRMLAASRGYGLDILKSDAVADVRISVAMACAYENYNRHDIIIELSEDTDLGVLRCVAQASGRDGAVVQSVAENAIAAYNNSDKDYMANKMINLVLADVAKNSDFEGIDWYVYEQICRNPDLYKSCTDRDTYNPVDGPDNYHPALVELAKSTESVHLLTEIAKMTEKIPSNYRYNENEYTSAAKGRLKELGYDVKKLLSKEKGAEYGD